MFSSLQDFKSITESYRVLQSSTAYYSVSQSITELYRVLQSIAEYYRVLQNITEYFFYLDQFLSLFLHGSEIQANLCRLPNIPLIKSGNPNHVLANNLFGYFFPPPSSPLWSSWTWLIMDLQMVPIYWDHFCKELNNNEHRFQYIGEILKIN